MQTFGSQVAHLFEHLDNEVKDNPIYDKYEKERINWKDTTLDYHWKLPTHFDEAKSFVYYLYKSVAELGDMGYTLPADIISDESGNYNNSIQSFNNQFLDYFQQVLQEIMNANPEFGSNEAQKVSGSTVFIIHGHDNEIKTEVQLLLTRAGVNHVVLHEQPDKGRTIIDKLVGESASSNYAIALLSPDDRLDDGTTRARQNVILEVGYFIGRLGKERVRLIKKDTTEVPSDLQGILYEQYDKSGAWKMKICKELIAVGIYVDLQSVANTL